MGFGTSLFGGLSLNGSKQDYERLYLNNLLRSVFEPDFGVGRTAADLNLGLKLGNTRVWTDLQFKAVTNWMSLLRLELPIPMPKSGLKFKLGTIYTGPTFGTNEVFFDQNLDFKLNNNEAHVFSEFRNGSADQDALFGRISTQLLENDLSGLLIVEPSADARDVMTGLSRDLALFDVITPSDRVPDALSIISSLQALPLLLQHHFNPTPKPQQVALNENYLNGIAGFDELSIGAASSYIGLEDPDPEVRSLALKQLQMEYQLQALLLATADALRSFDIQKLNLASSYPTLPQSDGLNAYLPLALYAQQQQSLQQSNKRVPFLDLGSAASLKQYFTFLAGLIRSSDASLADQSENVSAAMDLLADLLASLNRQIVTVSSAAAELIGLSHGPALALVGLKQIMQGGSFADLLESLQQDAVDAAALKALFDRLMQTPRSAQNGLSFAEA
ncbi:MAG: hypothetical protein EB116_16920, partial [Betaproteobacteria bacterium]|nr:hypothetical protein [Betaproteobacteria bacterium]